MGNFHVYCVICGAATTEVEIGPREQPDDDEDVYMENKYDEDVIGDEDMEWFQQARVLGFNPDAAGASKFYVSGAGNYLGYGDFDIDEGSEPDSAIEEFDFADLRAWGGSDGTDRVFPFHKQCYTLLARVLTGTEDTNEINRAVLYKVFGGLVSGKSRCSDLDYGDATQGQDQTWEAVPGYEYTVINPEKRESLTQDILEVIKHEKFAEAPSNLHLRDKVRWDPFRQLPESLLRDILDLVDNESVFNLCKASWGIFEFIRHIRNFWESRIRKNTPYFEELWDTLEAEQESLREQDPRKILLWAEEASKPRVGMSGFLMPVANRRRIWGVCEQIERLYDENCPERDTTCDMEDIAMGNKMHFVGYNGKTVVDTEQSYWIQSWDEYSQDRPWTLHTFWNSDWDMTGISVSFEDEEPRMFGRCGEEEGAWETVKELPSERWIRGFVFHVRPPSVLLDWGDASWNYISVKGISIHFDDDSKVTYGQTDASLMQRPLFVAKDMIIVGVQGQLAEQEKEDVTPWILRFGLLQAYAWDEERPNSGWYPEIRAEEGLSWSSASLSRLDVPIWESKALKFITGNIYNVEGTDLKVEHIPTRILLLGNHPHELSNVRSISACVNNKGIHEYGGQRYFDNAITNMRVSFADGQKTRAMREVDDDGYSWPEENWEEFEIDGPGGEIIEEISWVGSYGRSPEHLQLRTNRNRTVLFAADILANENNTPTGIHVHERTANDRRDVIKAEEGDVIVGIVMGFRHRVSDYLDDLDKEDSAELSEAINSMYQWYRDSTICYAYLEDVEMEDWDNSMSLQYFTKSRWFTRGWTLQELIAPRTVEFYTSGWAEIGTKRSLIAQIETITGIPARILHGEKVSVCNVAQRMSWASKRQTTRREDRAYSLMGLFQINMPLLYGEGDRAFVRLQEQILRQEEDYSIFAWTLHEDCLETILTGCLASSPSQFANMASKGVVRPSGRGGLRAFKSPQPLSDHTMEPYYNNDMCQVMGAKNYERFRGPSPGLNIGMPLKPPEFTARGVSISLPVRPAPDTWLSAMAWIYSEVDERLVCVLLKPYASDPICIHARFSSPVLISVDKSLLSEFTVMDLFLPASGFWDLYPELDLGRPTMPSTCVRLEVSSSDGFEAHVVSIYPNNGWDQNEFYCRCAPNNHGVVLIECAKGDTVARFKVSCGIHEGNPWCSIREVLGANEQDQERILEDLRQSLNQLDSVWSGYMLSTMVDRSVKMSVKIPSMAVSAKIRQGPKDAEGTLRLRLQITVNWLTFSEDWVRVYARQHAIT
ncbi:hypothetical protein CEP54_014253 [Fusarium duplospermum]|uniref:F-box domain-containing protein n=1 Tax=Fusarium duplospermum TaxID=1325734 RepID=A0A428NXK2_9HYPO|nr:hypothetical protein CEP54_014253 [Fusarium duplospermum]